MNLIYVTKQKKNTSPNLFSKNAKFNIQLTLTVFSIAQGQQAAFT